MRLIFPNEQFIYGKWTFKAILKRCRSCGKINQKENFTKTNRL